MATTTNYSWTTPDDTDLVKDGASAIRTLGSAIDTTVFTNAGAAVAKSLIDAEGDLIVGDAADAVQRLAIGSNGNVLTVDTAVDGKIKWAAPAADTNGLKKITSATFSAVSSVSLANDTFTSTYRNYRLLLNIDTVQTSPSGIFLRMRASGSDNTNGAWYGQRFNVPYTGATSLQYSTSGGTSIQISDAYDKSLTSFEIGNPQTAQRTAINYIQTQGELVQYGTGAATQIDSTQFDALSFFMTSGTMTGRYSVYGYEN